MTNFRTKLRPKLSLYQPSSYWFNHTDIEKIEKHYNGRFMIETSMPVKGGGWSYEPLTVFWTPNKHPEGSNYFAMWYKGDGLFITDGIAVETMDITGMVAGNGKDVIYSRYRHDFVTSPDGTVSIDGGRDYTKHMFNTTTMKPKFKPSLVNIVIKDGEISYVWPQEEPTTTEA